MSHSLYFIKNSTKNILETPVGNIADNYLEKSVGKVPDNRLDKSSQKYLKTVHVSIAIVASSLATILIAIYFSVSIIFT